MPQQPIQEMNCDVEGIFPPVAGILGSLQANEVLKTILDLKDDLNGNILIFDSCSKAISSNIGPIILHGPHHSAQKSTNIGNFEFLISSSKLLSVIICVLIKSK